MTLSESYKAQLIEMHGTRTDFGANGSKWLPAVLDLLGDGETLLDYGCGRGSLVEALRSQFPDAGQFAEYDPGIPGKDAKPSSADVVVCTDVAEHIEPEFIDAFIDDLARVTTKRLFLNVATRPAKKTLPDGRNAHLTQKPWEWWVPRLGKHFVVRKAHVDNGEFTVLLHPRIEPLKVFIGYDERQPAAFTVAMHSLIKYASQPIQIIPLVLQTLPTFRFGLTPFTFTRFLVPWLCGYQGRALFVDADVMFRGDVYELLKHDKGDAVTVVKHPDKRYEWPSVMLFNNEKCRQLTPEFVSEGKGLLTLNWTDSIGELPKEWNQLVAYNDPNPNALLAHFTQGLPCYPQTQHDEFAEEWRQTATQAISAQPWELLMGPSVHAEHVERRAA